MSIRFLEVGFNRELLSSRASPDQDALLTQGFSDGTVGNPVFSARHLDVGNQVVIVLFDLAPLVGPISGLSFSMTFSQALTRQLGSPVGDGQSFSEFRIFPATANKELGLRSTVFEETRPAWFVELGAGETFPASQLQETAQVKGTPAFTLRNRGGFYYSLSLHVAWQDGTRQKSFRIDPEMIVDHGGELDDAEARS